jgi:hypothetical protein
MSDDRPANTVVRDPFDNRLSLDVAKLLERYLLQSFMSMI